MTKKIVNIIIALLGISFVIFVHELGHYLASLYFDVPVPLFSIGFGPTLFSFKLGQTLFKISALPLGGYVFPDPKILAEKPYSVKMIVTLAGIVTNVLFSYFTWFFIILSKSTKIAPIINTVVKNSPAEHAGLQKNDRITRFNGAIINGQTALLAKLIQEHPDQTTTLTIDRDGKTVTQEIMIGSHPDTPEIGWLGVQFKTVPAQRPSILKAFSLTWQTFTSIFGILVPQKRKSKSSDKGQIIGPLGIISLIAQSISQGFKYFMLVLASISANVGLFNLLPLPFLDGGKAMIYTIEKIAGKSLPANASNVINLIFILLFLAFILFITFKDLRRMKK